MADTKIWKVAAVLNTPFVGSVSAGEFPASGSAMYQYRNVWGIMVANSAAGVVSMSGGGGISLAHIATGTVVPCVPLYVSCSAGTVYLLA